MKFLLPVGGVVDQRFGILTSPAHNGIPIGIKEGMFWAADNNAYTRGFDPDRFFPWLYTMKPYRDTCLFVTVPDVVGDAHKTLNNFYHWRGKFNGWPLAYVGQDGSENLPIPECQALFIGGTTEWKLSRDAISVIKHGVKKNCISTLDV